MAATDLGGVITRGRFSTDLDYLVHFEFSCYGVIVDDGAADFFFVKTIVNKF